MTACRGEPSRATVSCGWTKIKHLTAQCFKCANDTYFSSKSPKFLMQYPNNPTRSSFLRFTRRGLLERCVHNNFFVMSFVSQGVALSFAFCSVWPSCYHEGPFRIILKSAACSLLLKLQGYVFSLVFNAFPLKKTCHIMFTLLLAYRLSLFGRPFRSTYLSLNKGCQSLRCVLKVAVLWGGLGHLSVQAMPNYAQLLKWCNVLGTFGTLGAFVRLIANTELTCVCGWCWVCKCRKVIYETDLMHNSCSSRIRKNEEHPIGATITDKVGRSRQISMCTAISMTMTLTGFPVHTNSLLWPLVVCDAVISLWGYPYEACRFHVLWTECCVSNTLSL